MRLCLCELSHSMVNAPLLFNSLLGLHDSDKIKRERVRRVWLYLNLERDKRLVYVERERDSQEVGY